MIQICASKKLSNHNDYEGSTWDRIKRKIGVKGQLYGYLLALMLLGVGSISLALVNSASPLPQNDDGIVLIYFLTICLYPPMHMAIVFNLLDLLLKLLQNKPTSSNNNKKGVKADNKEYLKSEDNSIPFFQSNVASATATQDYEMSSIRSV
jgi:hypothetical protein